MFLEEYIKTCVCNLTLRFQNIAMPVRIIVGKEFKLLTHSYLSVSWSIRTNWKEKSFIFHPTFCHHVAAVSYCLAWLWATRSFCHHVDLLCSNTSLHCQEGEFHWSSPLQMEVGCMWPTMQNEFVIAAVDGLLVHFTTILFVSYLC